MKYGELGTLFVNVSLGGTLTSFAAPPVLMDASDWLWDRAFIATIFDWNAFCTVLINATAITYLLRWHVTDDLREKLAETQAKDPLLVNAIHLLFLAAMVLFARHPVIFMGIFFLISYTQACGQCQNPLILKEGFLVGFFLAGLVILG